MPSIKQMLVPPKNQDGSPKQWDHSEPLASLQKNQPKPGEADEPGMNPYLRCSLPAINASNSDALRQWYRRGISQFRIWLKQ